MTTDRLGEQLKGSWRTALGKPYLAAEDFEPEKPVTLTIAKVSKEELHRARSTEVKIKGVIWFKEVDRGFVMNPTKGAAIAKILGTPMVHEWPGKRITLTRGRTRLGKETVDCIEVVGEAGESLASEMTLQDDSDTTIPPDSEPPADWNPVTGEVQG